MPYRVIKQHYVLPLTVRLALPQAVSIALEPIVISVTASVDELFALFNGSIVVVGREVSPAGSWIRRKSTGVDTVSQSADD